MNFSYLYFHESNGQIRLTNNAGNNVQLPYAKFDNVIREFYKFLSSLTGKRVILDISTLADEGDLDNLDTMTMVKSLKDRFEHNQLTFNEFLDAMTDEIDEALIEKVLFNIYDLETEQTQFVTIHTAFVSTNNDGIDNFVSSPIGTHLVQLITR